MEDKQLFDKPETDSFDEFEKSGGFFSRVNFKQIMVLVLVLIVGYMLYVNRGAFIVATVNGKPITRYELLTELEKQGGKQALDSIVIQKLVNAKAQDSGIEIGNDVVAEEVKGIKELVESQGLGFDEALSMQGLTMEDLISQVLLQKKLEALLNDSIGEITDEEVQEYITTNALLFEGLSEEEQLTKAREQIKQQKIGEQAFGYVENLKAEANIEYLREY